VYYSSANVVTHPVLRDSPGALSRQTPDTYAPIGMQLLQRTDL